MGSLLSDESPDVSCVTFRAPLRQQQSDVNTVASWNKTSYEFIHDWKLLGVQMSNVAWVNSVILLFNKGFMVHTEFEIQSLDFVLSFLKHMYDACA